ncbi:MAG TPA: hypothetical protein VIE65_02795 [Methylobacter sp.]|jgi:hypothetical protein
MEHHSRSLGQVGYEAYGDDAQWKAYDGNPMPKWTDLRFDIKRKWEVAAQAIVDFYEKE